MFEGLTNKGKEYMAKCLAENKPVSFAKVKIGDGSIGHEENPETFTDVKSIKKEVSIADKVQVGDTVKLTVQLDNTGVLEGYFPREIGIYVQDEGQELLYWYINDDFESSWLPPASKSPVKFKYHINLMATNLETVIVNWSGKELWVDREYLGKELDKKLSNGNLPATFTNAEIILKALQGNTGIKFDENLLYLNDAGTKKKGFCYLDKLTDGIFECIQETTTTVNGATYFKNFSNKENSDRLSNLIKVKNLHRIDSNFDFNNLIKRGVYSANTYKNDCPKNFPINENLGMNILVIECGTSSYLTQLVLTSREHFFRMYDTGLFQWTKWQKYSLIEV